MPKDDKAKDGKKLTNEERRARDHAAKEKKLREAKYDVGDRYELLRPVGSGAYGLVWSARDKTDTNCKPGKGNVAIKKVPNPFDHKIDAKRMMREILLLLSLKHPNILGVRELIAAYEEEGNLSLYIVTDLMDVDLHKIIQSPQNLSDRHIQYFTYQILRGLKYIHSAGILHRDIKPSNILLNEDCQLRICDFGLARAVPRKTSEEHKEEGGKLFMTEYVVTRWYRSPELLLQEKYYTAAIDVWSTGCILAEMLGRKPIFPGNNYINQLLCITNIRGTPKKGELDFGSEQARHFLQSLEDCDGIPLSNLYPNANPQVIDLLDRMLQFNHNKRISVDDALSHPYLAHLHDANQEPTAKRRFLFQYDGMTLTRNQMKEIVLREVIKFRPEMTPHYEKVVQENKEAGEELPAPLPEKEGESAPLPTGK